MKAFLLATLLSLSGCSLAPFGDKAQTAIVTAVETAKEDRMAYNDKKAETLLLLPCDMSIGAYMRLTNSVQQEAVGMLCSGKRPGEATPILPTADPMGAPLP